jgi:cyclophilin family peptidyl-prolyl cis-trans isomerase
MKKIISFLFAASFIFVQCSKDNFQLVKTTYQRTFDKEIISSYLSSKDPNKVNAALLSISHSEDTSFVPEVISASFKEYPKMICFALGQMGSCDQSSLYIWSKIFSDEIVGNSSYLFEALGKTGTEEDLTKIIEMYANFDGPTFPYDGISIAIRNFAQRGMINDRAKQILIDEVNNLFNSIQNNNEALFSLARNGSSEEINNELIRILNLPKTDNPDTVKAKQYALMNLRTQKYFPKDEDLINNVLNENSALLKIEAAKAICYRDIKTFRDLESCLILLDSDNPNVSRAAANSIRFIKLEDEELKEYLEIFLFDKIQTEIPDNTRGELFISLITLFPHQPDSFRPGFLFSNKILSNYWYEYIGTMENDSAALSQLLIQFEDKDNLSEKISILGNLLNFQQNFILNEVLYDVIFSNLTSEFAPLVSIAADGIDSGFIARDKSALVKIIKSSISKEKDNPDFMEGTMSLMNLAEKVDKDLFNEIANELSKSKLYSVRKFVANKTGQRVEGGKSTEHLDEILENAFKFKIAEIKTEKGLFIIEFLPQYAPVSVGNFCNLAKNGFYNGIEFHRVVPGFVIQCGDPTATGWGGPGYDIVSEFSHLSYDIGMVGMASAGKDTEGSQWFVMQGNYPHLDGRYTVFAFVAKGMDIVYNIDQNDKIINIELFP